MKLLIINAVKAFEAEVKKLLLQAKVHSFSYSEVNGFRDSSQDAIQSNWFASELNETESVLFYAFVAKDRVDTVFEMIGAFNAQQEVLSQIHVAVLNIEKSN
ncbi:hypothetical protein G4D82_10035 [Flavobacterium sp. CYK-4]|uniref:hypothetical protein n=1 Tax=Flavobacterium lotistagni TaxID=2709660 RepID=UPI00140C25B9|nr:hypothetical protein [Flavobacterium lotistagni]NHM07560.1 hypothetical protein [Flavobacterium lotistagni]